MREFPNNNLKREYKKPLDEKFWSDIFSRIEDNVGGISPQRLRAEFITKLFNIPQGWYSSLGVKEKDEEAIVKDRPLLSKDIEFQRNAVEYTTPNLDRALRKYILHRTTGLGEYKITEEEAYTEDFSLSPYAEEDLESFREKVEKMQGREKELGLSLYRIFKGLLDLPSALESEDKIEKVKILEERLKYIHLAIEESNPFSFHFPFLIHEMESILKELSRMLKGEVNFHYLPGGNPLFFQGYTHDGIWGEAYHKDFASIYKDASIISIEAFSNMDFGKSINNYWKGGKKDIFNYEELMRRFIKEGFDGVFIETDARNSSRVPFDESNVRYLIPKSFYEKYVHFLRKENEKLVGPIKNGSMLDNLSKVNRLGDESAEISYFHESSKDDISIKREGRISFDDKEKKWEVSSFDRGFSFGRELFTDALAALKFLTLSELMNRGNVEKGIMVDIQGSMHTNRKSFFIKYPQYAMEVVLRSIHLLMGQDSSFYKRMRDGMDVLDNVKKAEDFLSNPDWNKVIYEIGRIPVFRVKKDFIRRDIEPGIFQAKMEKIDEYNIFNDALRKNGNIKEMIEKLFDDDYMQSVIEKYGKKRA